MLGLDIIGAGEGLSAFTILLRIKSIDPAKFRAAVTEKSWGAALPGAITVVDSAPDLALGMALPVVQTQLAKMGVTADLSTTKTPPKATSHREIFVVLGIGTALGLVLGLAGRTLYHALAGLTTIARRP